MQLKNLLHLLPDSGILQKFQNFEIENITDASYDVNNNTIFFAMQGSVANGNDFILHAIEKGAIFIIYSKQSKNYVAQKLGLADNVIEDVYLYKSACLIAVPDAKECLVNSAKLFWKKKPNNIVAVTGTSGKTSVAWFTNQLWQIMGYKSSFIGTLGVSALPRKKGKNLTTPGLLDLFKTLNDLKEQNIDYVVMEASSHGINQGRINNIDLACAAFTNFGRDHLDYHQTSENYFLAKMKLFKDILPSDAPALIFDDDKYSKDVINTIKEYNKHILTIGSQGSFIKVLSKNNNNFELEINSKIYKGEFYLEGEFQWHNALMSLGFVITLGANIELAVNSLSKVLPVPGRMQLIAKNINSAKIYVDYAHKPEALESVLLTMRCITTGRIILVFGCGGDRDRGKRPIMGAIAQTLADIVIVTDDNPRYETAVNIRKEILKSADKAIEIGDRAEAIKYAIDIAKENDTVLIVGKGHETGQQIGNVVYNFSDEQEILKYLNK